MYKVICKKCGLTATSWNLRDENKRYAECSFCKIRNEKTDFPDFDIKFDDNLY